ncbi:hypothetical protein ASD65_11260 [Microbacterium sp. Root61]|uniref:MarR family winged helix-turn-helix transcriptional regulator n=1 Tax=Microbacterium sp. Root61 TaxID=1736570 RepID=UPI0006F41D63|nr:MarR family transcriptional regulator [Microbacterium sp. Root61]KRA24942.1 hypothetical protein ASD65_11260 [Microbacterium sp. Root61]
MTTRETDEAIVLSGLTRLMAQWSSLALQARYVHDVGVAIDPVDVRPLYALGLGGRMRAGDLASDLHVSRPTMSKQLTRLAAAGLITRSADPHDGRATIVALSASGTRAFDALVARGLEMVDRVMADWKPEERHQLAGLVHRFVATASTVVTQDAENPTSDGDPVGSNPDIPETRDRP